MNPDDIDLLEYEGSSIPTVMDGDDRNYIQFYNYIKTTDLSIEKNFRFLESWMDIDEYLNCEDIHIYNKNIVKTAMKNIGLKLENHNYFTNSDNQHEYYF